ncbi:MAG: cold shock domain-containing protein [Bacteroidota bacterium]
MGRSQETFNKKEKEKKKLKKRQEKEERKRERKDAKNERGGSSLDDMIAYVDEFGNIVDTPPDPTKKEKVVAKNIEIGIPKKVEDPNDKYHRGRVEFFNTKKGYGFIREDGTNESYFVHVNGLTEEITDGDKVEFELEKGMKGMNAVNVKKQ